MATGARLRQEAINAVPRIRPQLAGRPLWVVCDGCDLVPEGLFDAVLPHPDPQCGDRDMIPPLLRLPFARTLLLGPGLVPRQPLDDFFRLLEGLHVVGCHASPSSGQWSDPEVPAGFCELSSGLLGLRRCPRVRRLLRNWLTTYDKAGVPCSQASLRSALWHATCGGLRLWVLPPDYSPCPAKTVVAGANSPVPACHPTPLVAAARAERPPAACRRLFVLGAGRSGTSLMAGLFRHAGMFMGATPYKSRACNPYGFFEDREVNAINEELLTPLLPPPPARRADGLGEGWDIPGAGMRWLARLPLSAQVAATPEQQQRILKLFSHGPCCFKDPRFCYTLAAWRELLPPQDRQHCAYLCVFRHPGAVLASVLQEVHTAHYLRRLAISVEQVLACWQWQYRHVLERHAFSGRWLFVSYEQLLDPAGLDQIEAFTGHLLDRSLPQQRLNRSRPEQDLPGSVIELYRQLCARAGWTPPG